MSTNLGACHAHEMGRGGGRSEKNKSAEELTRRDRITIRYPAPPGDSSYNRPGVTFAVDWALKTNDLSIFEQLFSVWL